MKEIRKKKKLRSLEEAGANRGLICKPYVTMFKKTMTLDVKTTSPFARSDFNMKCRLGTKMEGMVAHI
jgi:hypothetical protein